MQAAVDAWAAAKAAASSTDAHGSIWHSPTRKIAPDSLHLRVGRSPCLTIVVDSEPPFGIVAANSAWLNHCGWGRECIGAPPKILQGPGSDRRLASRFTQELLSTGSATMQIVNYTKRQVPFLQHVTAELVRCPGGRVLYVTEGTLGSTPTNICCRSLDDDLHDPPARSLDSAVGGFTDLLTRSAEERMYNLPGDGRSCSLDHTSLFPAILWREGPRSSGRSDQSRLGDAVQRLAHVSELESEDPTLTEARGEASTHSEEAHKCSAPDRSASMLDHAQQVPERPENARAQPDGEVALLAALLREECAAHDATRSRLAADLARAQEELEELRAGLA